MPIVAPFDLGLNGNAITVSPALYARSHRGAELASDGDIDSIRTWSIARRVRWRASSPRRKAKGDEPLTFGMTFPFSTHNYQLRFWMAAGGVDPDEDVRLVVLPPPYMVESLANGHVDGFCVGAPWNSVAVDLGIGRILHFVSEILARAAEKVLGCAQPLGAGASRSCSRRLVRAHARAAAFVEDVANRDEVSGDPGRAQPHRRRLRGDPAHARWPPEGRA